MCGVLGAWIVAARLCKPDQRAGQFILQTGGVGGFAAYAYFFCAAGALCGLLALNVGRQDI